ncbi:MAG: hypothetical protein WCO18_02690 [bacterium]
MKTNQRILMVLGFISAMLYRFIPFRPPNVEPLMSVMMPFSKKVSKIELFVFAFLSIFIYDLFTAGIGTYTITAGICYGLLGIWSSSYFANRKFGLKNLVICSTFGIIFFDAVTGVIIGPMLSGGSYYLAFIGQIPFTALHLMGGTLFAITLSPLIVKILAKSEVSVLQLDKSLQEAKA